MSGLRGSNRNRRNGSGHSKSHPPSPMSVLSMESITVQEEPPRFDDHEEDDVVNPMDFLQLKYDNCEFLEDESQENEQVRVGVVDQDYEVVEVEINPTENEKVNDTDKVGVEDQGNEFVEVEASLTGSEPVNEVGVWNEDHEFGEVELNSTEINEQVNEDGGVGVGVKDQNYEVEEVGLTESGQINNTADVMDKGDGIIVIDESGKVTINSNCGVIDHGPREKAPLEANVSITRKDEYICVNKYVSELISSGEWKPKVTWVPPLITMKQQTMQDFEARNGHHNSLDDGSETSNSDTYSSSDSSNNAMPNRSFQRNVKQQGLGETPLYTLNPSDFPNDSQMRSRIRVAQYTRKRHLEFRQHLIATDEETRALRKWNTDLRATVLELINCGCQRANKADVSEVLSRVVPQVPPLKRRYFGELPTSTSPPPSLSPPSTTISTTGVVPEALPLSHRICDKLPQSPLPSLSPPLTTLSSAGVGEELRKRQLSSAVENSLTPSASPPQKMWRPDIEVKSKSPGSQITSQPFTNTKNCVSSASKSLTYPSQFGVPQEQKQKLWNVVGYIPTTEPGPRNYEDPFLAGLSRIVFANNLYNTTPMLGNQQTTAAAPPYGFQNMFSNEQ